MGIFGSKDKEDKKSADAILDALKPIAHALGKPLNELFLQVLEEDGDVGIVMDFGQEVPTNTDAVKADVEQIVFGQKGVKTVNIVMTGANEATPQPEAPVSPQQPAPAARPSKPPAGAPKPPTPSVLPGVRHVVAVASGKGGVGKSTTTINLALAATAQGLKVGVLDADIFGPSLPKLTGSETEKPDSDEAGKIIPIEAMGMKIMSIGYMINPEEPIVWRGPRLMGALQQLVKDVVWGELDILFVDLPPGTGDVQLSLVQYATLSGAVIVSTPQDLALLDARKGLEMFRKTNTPILGIIENMSYYLCPSCGHQADIFGHGGARETAEKLGVPFLGEVPLHMNIRATADAGNPVVHGRPMSGEAKIYRDIADKVSETLGV